MKMSLIQPLIETLVEYFSLDNNSIIPAGSKRRNEALEDTVNHMNSTLYDAVIKDNIDVLVEMEGSLDVQDELTPTRSTVLHLACQYGSVKCVEHILSVHESLLLKMNSRGETAVHLAARQGHFEVVVALLDAAKSSLLKPEFVRAESIKLSTILLTSLSRLIDLAHELMTKKTLLQLLIRKSNVESETPLHDAVRHNHKSVVQRLLDEDPSYSYPQNTCGETPLYMASARGYTEIISTILCKCESPTFGGPDGRTALHAAVLVDDGHEILQISECVKLLLDKNKDLVGKQDDYGWTIFHYVAHNDLYTIVEGLAGADKKAAYLVDFNDKRTALHVAAHRGNIRVMEKLVEYFPDCWEMVDGNRQNILHISVEQERKEVIRYILSQGCQAYSSLITQRDKDGNTPLHLITELGCYVKELMDERSLDWEVLNNKNFTPLDLIHCRKETDTQNDQDIVKRTLVKANVKKHWQLLRTLKETDIEKANRVVIENEKNTKEAENYKKWINTHMVVAALITTVALTAGFTMPGGFDGNPGLTQGSAILLRKKSFEGFIVTDTIALLCSITSLFLYFMTTMYEDLDRIRKLFFVAVLFNTASIITIMLAFITGTYAVLNHSSTLAICITLISCLFISIAFMVFVRMLSTVLSFLAPAISVEL